MPQLATKKINRTSFFNRVRESFYHGKLSQEQVDGLNTIIDEWESRSLTDLRWLAYLLATVYHEAAGTFRPIAEYGKGKGYRYGKPDPITGEIYYGRGFCQITWKYNYETFAKLLNVDLVHKPDLALDCKIATDIIFEGMLKGLFTGKKLSDYFNISKEDWEGARRIINGQDKASLIAAYSKLFYLALL